MILRNQMFFQEMYTKERINNEFDELDSRYSTPENLQWYKEQEEKASETVEFLEQNRPHKSEVSDCIEELISTAKHSIRIVQPYVQHVTHIENLLVDALKRGVKVEIITARIRDQPCYAGLLNAELFRKPIQAGAIVREEPYSFLHMKLYDIDNGEKLSIGSMNQDNWSFKVNNEANLLFTPKDSSKKGSYYSAYWRVYQRLWNECRDVDKADDYYGIAYLMNSWWDFFFYCSHVTARDRSREGQKYYKHGQ